MGVGRTNAVFRVFWADGWEGWGGIVGAYPEAYDEESGEDDGDEGSQDG